MEWNVRRCLACGLQRRGRVQSLEAAKHALRLYPRRPFVFPRGFRDSDDWRIASVNFEDGLRLADVATAMYLGISYSRCGSCIKNQELFPGTL